jgi:phosphoribosylaminoimidazole (AIR) synthetase
MKGSARVQVTQHNRGLAQGCSSWNESLNGGEIASLKRQQTNNHQRLSVTCAMLSVTAGKPATAVAEASTDGKKFNIHNEKCHS